ncbi:MAG: prepilin-type N-terminal cleavage/methylation domain-containing protein [Gammaproteobacteria bacterium]|nr:prepilin-type N-terminal cleavage/methylation domain-containing protein [Gammaproteobacteria bacterium]
MTTHFINGEKQTGFTLVELLIVAIILAILAAIVVPQFASSTSDASNSALRSNLSSIRGAIDLYTQQHGGTMPGAAAATTAACTAGTAGTGLANSEAAFKSQLKFYTNLAGAACSVADNDADGTPEFPFGPYIKGDVPANPITSNPTVAIVSTGNLVLAGNATPAGWKYDTKSGRFIADDSTDDGNGTPYDTY